MIALLRWFSPFYLLLALSLASCWKINPEAKEAREFNNHSSSTAALACQSCHPKEFAAWSAEPHASATQKLGNRQQDPTCLKCHATFYDGGSVHLLEVTCDACHGPGQEHVSNPRATNLARNVPKERCATCHTPDCPDECPGKGKLFDYGKALPKVRHPQPAASPPKDLITIGVIEDTRCPACTTTVPIAEIMKVYPVLSVHPVNAFSIEAQRAMEDLNLTRLPAVLIPKRAKAVVPIENLPRMAPLKGDWYVYPLSLEESPWLMKRPLVKNRLDLFLDAANPDSQALETMVKSQLQGANLAPLVQVHSLQKDWETAAGEQPENIWLARELRLGKLPILLLDNRLITTQQETSELWKLLQAMNEIEE